MIAFATWPVLVAVAGALLYAFAPPKPARLGELAFFVGLFWLVYALARTAVRF